jgi:copper(I)-binding protein
MRKTVFAALLLAGAPLALSACSEAEAPAEASDPNTIAGLTITDARMMLPPVAGNPAAVYFTVKNDGDKNIALRSASVEGSGSAQLHDMMEYDFEMTMGEMPPLMLQPGHSVVFEPGGKHVMVYELGPDLAEGGTAEVTLTAAGGRNHTFEAPIQAAGEER